MTNFEEVLGVLVGFSIEESGSCDEDMCTGIEGEMSGERRDSAIDGDEGF